MYGFCSLTGLSDCATRDYKRRHCSHFMGNSLNQSPLSSWLIGFLLRHHTYKKRYHSKKFLKFINVSDASVRHVTKKIDYDNDVTDMQVVLCCQFVVPPNPNKQPLNSATYYLLTTNRLPLTRSFLLSACEELVYWLLLQSFSTLRIIICFLIGINYVSLCFTGA